MSDENQNELLDSRHWTEGGTLVTNFQAHELPTFIEAVKRFGDNRVIVTDRACPPAPDDYGGSLHSLLEEHDLSNFWRVFDQVRSESNPVSDQTDPGGAVLNCFWP